MSFKDDFEKIVVEIAKQAQDQATCFADRIEALKVLNQSYALMRKYPDDDDGEDEAFSFEKGLKTEEPKNGAAKIRTRPGGH